VPGSREGPLNQGLEPGRVGSPGGHREGVTGHPVVAAIPDYDSERKKLFK